MAIVVRWFPQSFVQICAGDRTAYIDPALGSSFLDLMRLALPPHGRNIKLPAGMGPGQLVLATHAHGDHLARGMVEQLSDHETKVVAPESCRKKLGDRMTAVAPGDALSVAGMGIEVVHAYNPEGSRRMTYHPRGRGVGYVLTVEGKRIYHAGDTGLIEEMGAIGPVDIAFLPIGGRFTMDIAEAAEAVNIIQPRMVVPMHLLKADPHAFRELVNRGKGSEARVLSPGEALTLEG